MDIRKMGFILGVLVVSFLFLRSVQAVCTQNGVVSSEINCKMQNSHSWQQDMYNCVKNGDLDGLKGFVLKGCDVNFVDKDGKNLLYVASQENNLEIMRYLVQVCNCVHVNTQIAGWTTLYNACYNNNLEMVKFLLQNGAVKLINKDSVWGRTPLYWACRNNNLQMAKILLLSGASKHINKETMFFGGTNLYWACHNGNLAMVKLLVENGADINKVTKYDESLLYWACEYNREDILRYIFGELKNVLDLECLSRPNKYSNETPLYWACYYNNFDFVKILLDNGAKKTINNIVKDGDKNALYWVIKRNNVELVKCLIENGAIVSDIIIDSAKGNQKIHKYLVDFLKQ